MDISKRTILIIFLAISFHCYFLDLINDNTFKADMSNRVKIVIGENATHSLIDLFERRAIGASAVTSTALALFIGYLPV
jgi:hypothetical protein